MNSSQQKGEAALGILGDVEAPASSPLDVIVIGAGVTGLAAAERLAADGADVCCVEASAAVGGVTSTLARGGFLFERGPFNVLCRAPEFIELLRRLGNELRVTAVDRVAGARRGVIWNGAFREVPTGLWSALASPLLGLRGVARLVSGLLWSASSSPSAGSAPTIDEIVRRRFGVRVAERLVSALTVGVFGAESDELEAASALPFLAELDAGGRSTWQALRRRRREHMKSGSGRGPRADKVRGVSPPVRGMISFEGGLGALPRALAQRLGARLRTSAPVASLAAAEGGAWRVELADGTALLARDVVLAVGAREAARLLRTVDDSGFAPAVEALEGLRHVPLTVLNLGFRADAFRVLPRGYGFLVARGEAGESALGVLYASSVFPSHAPSGTVALRVFFGGTRRPEHARAPEPELVRLALATLHQHAGLLEGDVATPLATEVVRWPATVPLYEPGHNERIAAIRAALGNASRLHLAGAFVDGISVNDCIARGVRIARSLRANALMLRSER